MEVHDKINCTVLAHISSDDLNKRYVVSYTVPTDKIIASKAVEVFTDRLSADTAKAAWLAACSQAPTK